MLSLSALHPLALARDISTLQQKALAGCRHLAQLDDERLAIATTAKEEVWRDDMVRLYRYLPEAPPEQPPAIVLIAYALVGRYQMIDLEAERSFVRKLLARGLQVYVVDWA